MTSILFFALVLAVAGGAIAYMGDRLGTYIGKKRLSRFGLRPKHTAMLYTILSGGVIALLALAFLVVTDQAGRRALLEGPQLIYQNRQYRRQIKAEEAKAVVDQARAQQATMQLQQAQSQLLPIQQQLSAAQRTLNESREALQQRQAQLGQAQRQLVGVKTSLGATNVQLRLARADVQSAKQSLAGAERSVQVAQGAVRTQQRRVAVLTAEGRQLIGQNTRLKAQRGRLAARVEASRQDLIFRTGQEIGRVVVKTTQPVSVIEDQLYSYLDGLGQTAEQRGGRHGVNGRAVVITIPGASSGDYRPLSVGAEQEAVRALAQNIAGNTDQSVVVVARAVNNTFLGEQAGIELQPYDNVLVYPKGSVVATQAIDGTQSETQILNALQRFLTEQVRPAVRHQGLIPESDPLTGGPVLGTVDETTSLAVVHQIEQFGTSALVTALAGEDTYSSGPLHLRLSVSPASSVIPANARPDNLGRRS